MYIEAIDVYSVVSYTSYMDQNGRKYNHSLINSKPKQRYFRIELKHT